MVTWSTEAGNQREMNMVDKWGWCGLESLVSTAVLLAHVVTLLSVPMVINKQGEAAFQFLATITYLQQTSDVFLNTAPYKSKAQNPLKCISYKCFVTIETLRCT